MSKEMALRDPGGVIDQLASGYLTGAQMDVLRKSLAPGASDEEIALFIATARELGLSPLAGQVKAIRFEKDAPLTPFPTWEGLIAIATATGEYRGMDGPLWTDDGETWHEAWLKPTDPKAAKCVVYREGWAPSVGVAHMSEARRLFDEWVDELDPKTGKVMWEPNPFNPGKNRPKRRKTGRKIPMAQWKAGEDGGQVLHMLGKQAVRIALKKAFPHQCDQKLTPSQLKALHTLAKEMGYEGRQERLEAAGAILGHQVQSFKDLSRLEAADVLDVWGAATDVVDGLPDDIEDAEVVEDVARTGEEARQIASGRRGLDPEMAGERSSASSIPLAAAIAEGAGGAPWTDPPEAGEVDADGEAAAHQPALTGADTPHLERLLQALDAWPDGPAKKGWLAGLRENPMFPDSPEMCDETQAERAVEWLSACGHR
ncbi:MAG: hypothetical protein NVSMB32_09140 [Actinomycetota bacterium]